MSKPVKPEETERFEVRLPVSVLARIGCAAEATRKSKARIIEELVDAQLPPVPEVYSGLAS